jgi:uncharacterized protein YjbJ (UPF0337 family)
LSKERKQMDTTRIRRAAKLIDGSGKAAKVAGAGNAKLKAKGKADKAVGKGRSALGGKKDTLANGFST